ncbi:MAG: hypothetical protein AAF387_21850 [Pseudomonadota bacterium]
MNRWAAPTLFLVLLIGQLSVNALANPQCTHLGGPVICPDGITPGSGSVVFTPSGILWTDGNESLGQNPDPFVACPPPLSGGMGSPTDPLNGLGMEPTDNRNTPADVEEQLGLTQNPAPSPQSTTQTGVAPIGSNTQPVIVLNNGGSQLPLTGLNLNQAFQPIGTASIAPITGQTFIPDDKTPGYINDAPPAGSREAILNKFKGTGDIAGAIEALAGENSIDYDQATPADLDRVAREAAASNPLGPSARELKQKLEPRFAGTATNEELIHITRANCYETVHLAAWFAGAGTGPMPQSRGGLTPLIDPKTMTEWDGESVPRGKIVIGTTTERYGGQDEYGFFHVGVSLGNGLIANNHGDGLKIERIEDVFGGKNGIFLYSEIYIGDYVGYNLPDSGREFLTTTREDQAGFVDFSDGASDAEIQDLYQTEEKSISVEQARTTFQSDLETTKGRMAIIDATLGIGPYPNRTMTDDQADFNEFIVQVMEGMNKDKPFFYKDYDTWKAAQATPQTTKPQAAAPTTPSYEPPSPNAGYEDMSRFFVEAFGQAETAGLRTPKAQ